ncbi:MAG: hypothetical protein P1U56_23555 [Saprospiraceae bacterium]|nr:hypothetical protein [Saprospiraceae bacterium]
MTPKHHTFKQKPIGLCTYDSALEKIPYGKEWQHFIEEKLRINKEKIESLGYTRRPATAKDLPSIMSLIRARCVPFVIDQIKESDVYRCIMYGHVVLLEDSKGKLDCFQASVGYGNTERTSFAVFSLVSAQGKGKRLQVLAKEYTSLKAMQDGQNIMESWTIPSNFASIKNSLNYNGFYCTGFHPDLYLPGRPRITILQYLSPAGIYNNCISDHTLSAFISDSKQKDSFKLIACTDHEKLTQCFENDSYKIIAFASHKVTGGENAFLAVPSTELIEKSYE